MVLLEKGMEPYRIQIVLFIHNATLGVKLVTDATAKDTHVGMRFTSISNLKDVYEKMSGGSVMTDTEYNAIVSIYDAARENKESGMSDDDNLKSLEKIVAETKFESKDQKLILSLPFDMMIHGKNYVKGSRLEYKIDDRSKFKIQLFDNNKLLSELSGYDNKSDAEKDGWKFESKSSFKYSKSKYEAIASDANNITIGDYVELMSKMVVPSDAKIFNATLSQFIGSSRANIKNAVDKLSKSAKESLLELLQSIRFESKDEKSKSDECESDKSKSDKIKYERLLRNI